MKFPGKYEEAQELGERPVITLGGHHMVIRQAVERTTQTGKPMIELSLDTAPNDAQAGFFKLMFDSYKPKEGEAKKWPQGGKYYVVVTTDEGDTSPSFKNFVESLEKSNPGFIVPRADFVPDIFGGKMIGAVYCPEKDYYNGKEYVRHKIVWFCPDGKVGDVRIPPMRETKAYKEYASHGGGSGSDSGGWTTLPEDQDFSDLPFN